MFYFQNLSQADVTAKGLKMKKKDWESLLSFRKEYALKKKKHEKEITEIHFWFMIQSAFQRNFPTVSNATSPQPFTRDKYNCTNVNGSNYSPQNGHLYQTWNSSHFVTSSI